MTTIGEGIELLWECMGRGSRERRELREIGTYPSWALNDTTHFPLQTVGLPPPPLPFKLAQERLFRWGHLVSFPVSRSMNGVPRKTPKMIPQSEVLWTRYLPLFWAGSHPSLGSGSPPDPPGLPSARTVGGGSGTGAGGGGMQLSTDQPARAPVLLCTDPDPGDTDRCSW